jgi:hypothetical protein
VHKKIKKLCVLCVFVVQFVLNVLTKILQYPLGGDKIKEKDRTPKLTILLKDMF